MTTIKKQWWLFLIPLLIPSLVIGSRVLQTNKPLYVGGSGFKTDVTGERSSLGTLSYYLEKETMTNVINVRYFVTYQTGPHKGTSIYTLEYNRQDKTLIKSALVPPLKSVNETPKTWVWSNVEENAIHQVSAPVRALRFTRQVENHKGGNLPELAQHGAMLTRTR